MDTLQPAHGLLSRRSALGSLGLFALGLCLPLSGASAANGAEAFVRSNIDKSYAILNRGDSDREGEFRALLASMVDTKRVALFTLGPYARDLSRAEADSFVAAFTDYIAAIYQRGLETYKGRSLEVTGSTERAPGDVIVNVVAADEGQPNSDVHLDFRVRHQPDGADVITDLRVEGVWLGLTQREEITAYLQQHHGSIAELSSDVEKKAQQIRAEENKSRSIAVPCAPGRCP